GTGKITKVMINGNNWRLFDEMKIILPYDKTPENAVIQIAQGNSKKRLFKPQKEKHKQSNLSSKFDNELVNVWFSINSTHDPFIMLPVKINKLCRFYNKLKKNGFENTYEATHAKLAVKYFDTIFGRYNLKESDKLNILAPQSQLAADNSYLETALNLCNGLETVVNSYENSNNNRQNLIYKMWINSE
ncbi:MAG: hypothetical protein JXB48_17925, partial [Candidatus Latescibacteria bacterium]|nr:hypothetical protein [Candidatus Latescibacterota bacterium]